MATIKLSRKYHCYNDCSQAGCPTHEFTIEFHSVTDHTVVDNGRGEIVGYDPEELNCLVGLLRELDDLRADSPVKFEPATKDVSTRRRDK